MAGALLAAVAWTGRRYLRAFMEQNDGRADPMLAAHNSRGKAVRRYGERVPSYREAQTNSPRNRRLATHREWHEAPPGPRTAIE